MAFTVSTASLDGPRALLTMTILRDHAAVIAAVQAKQDSPPAGVPA